MKRIYELAKEIENWEKASKDLNDILESAGCKELDWATIMVYEKSEKWIKRLISKTVTAAQFLIGIATQLDEANNVSDIEVIVIESNNSETDELETYTSKGVLYAVISLSKATQKFLKKS